MLRKRATTTVGAGFPDQRSKKHPLGLGATTTVGAGFPRPRFVFCSLFI